jgi:hypothetical protein
MSLNPETVIQKRQLVLQRLRERRQESRHGLNQKSCQADDSMPLEYFVKPANLAESMEVVASTPSVITYNHEKQLIKIRERLKHAQNLKRSLKTQPSELEYNSASEENSSSAKKAFAQRKELLQDVISDHFRNNLKSWISSIEPDLGVSSTSVAELEEQQQEIEYRYKVLKLILDITKEELNKIERNIRAAKSLEN